MTSPFDGSPTWSDASDRAIAVVQEIRSCRFTEAAPDGEMLALAALLRCAHLLDSMASRDHVEPSDPLTSLGFRDVMETAINGLVSLIRPGETGRFLHQDYAARAAITKALGADDEFSQRLRDMFKDALDDSPGQRPFGQRVDLVLGERPELFDGQAEADRIKAMYSHLSNFAMHGGAGVLGDYLVWETSGIRLVPTPLPVVAPIHSLLMAVGFTEKLFASAKEQIEHLPA